MAPAQAGRVGEVAERATGIGVQRRRQATGEVAQRLGAVGRERDQVWSRISASVGGLVPVWRLFEHDVAVRTTVSERVDAGQRRVPLVRPGLGRALYPQPQLAERDVRVRLLEVEAGWYRPVADRERGLDEAGHAGRRLGVSDVGLDRADPERS